MNELINALRLRQLLLILVLVLTFEGIARKAAPPELSVPLFLLKDAIVVIMAYFVLRMPMPPAISFLWTAYKILVILFIPPVLATAWNDPWLAIFGAKQYLLFPMVGFATFLAFQNIRMEEILTYYRKLSLLIIPTALLALAQLHLPHDHWLNKSVNGDNLEGFSAAGALRVSSTFPFVAQYCTFLNVETFAIMIALQGWRARSLLWKITVLSLIPFLVFSSFITGSRGAVAGNTAIALLAASLVLIKFQVRNVVQVGTVIISLYLAVLVVGYFSPETTVAYSEREKGHLLGISSEIQERVLGSFYGLWGDPVLTTYFGNGLGVMSNGSGTFSPYAAAWRDYLWTESDFASTLFEGGLYLAVVWYGFRLYVILVTTRRFLKEVTGVYFVPIAFTQAFVIVIGILGTLGIQPPVAIWWWMGVGTSLLFWWKCVGPPDPEIKMEGDEPPPKKLVRGRSLYAEVLHPDK